MNIDIKSVFFNLRRQPVISTVTIIGTSLAIFLIMIVVMMAEVNTAPISPESKPLFSVHLVLVCYSNPRKIGRAHV